MIKNGDIIIKNRKAHFNYAIEDTFEAGIVLTGSEVKSLRAGKCSIKDAFVMDYDGELFLDNSTINEYEFASRQNHNPSRRRKLLLQKRVIQKLIGKIRTSGYSVIPISMYFNKAGRVKLEIGVGKGKTLVDKRETIKQRDWQREKAALLKREV